jgi:hypothetical protein
MFTGRSGVQEAGEQVVGAPFIQRQRIPKTTPRTSAGPSTVAPMLNREDEPVMRTYEFTIILSDLPEMTEEVAGALYEAGCSDGSPGSCNGVSEINFHREASSLGEAIQSAVQDIAKAGFGVERVEIEAPQVANLP